jgi:hypothetical protein
MVSTHSGYNIIFLPEKLKLTIKKETITESKTLMKLFTDDFRQTKYKHEISISYTITKIKSELMCNIINILNLGTCIIQYGKSNMPLIFDILYACDYLKLSAVTMTLKTIIKQILLTESVEQIKRIFNFDDGIDDNLRNSLDEKTFYWKNIN